MKTITLQIGNSDDKLKQYQWAVYVREIDFLVREYSNKVFFFSTSPNTEIWQNAAWIFDIYENASYALMGKIKQVRATHEQDSVAWTEGKTEFI